jgi:uroporphyrinogen-III synthase
MRTPDGRPILLIRGTGNERDANALASVGISTRSDSFTTITPGNVQAAQELLELAQNNQSWIIITSRNAIDFWSTLVGPQTLSETFSTQQQIKFAALGFGSADSLKALGVKEIVTPEIQSSKELLKLLATVPVSSAIIPSGNLAMPGLPLGLTEMGWTIESRVVYINSLVETIPASVQSLNKGEIAAVLLRSPSAARALAHFAPASKTPVFCGDQATAKQANELGLEVLATATDPSPATVAELILHTMEV